MRVHLDKKNSMVVIVFQHADEMFDVIADLTGALKKLKHTRPIAFGLALEGCPLNQIGQTKVVEEVLRAQSAQEGGHLDQGPEDSNRPHG